MEATLVLAQARFSSRKRRSARVSLPPELEQEPLNRFRVAKPFHHDLGGEGCFL